MNRILHLLFFTCILILGFSQNPKIKVDYKATQSKMESPGDVGCINDVFCNGVAGSLEIRVRTLFRTSTPPAITPCNKSNNQFMQNASGGWSCEYRVEVGSGTFGGGTCGTWYPLSSYNSNYPGDPGPGYIDTSAYPCKDILKIRMNGYEADNGSGSAGAGCNNVSDGACGGLVPYGTISGIPVTNGDNFPIDIGSVSNTLAPYCGSNWSPEEEVSITNNSCTSDGITNHYYSKWHYRWCWDETTLFDRHAGSVKIPAIYEYCSGATVNVSDSTEGFEANRSFSTYQWQKNAGSGWSDISGATSKDLSTNTLTNTTTTVIAYQIRRATLFCTDFLPTPTITRVYSNLVAIDVYPQPIAPTLYIPGTTPATGITICKGLFTYAQVDPGTGGYTDAVDILEYSINNGTTWNTYTAGYSINTSSATTAVLVRSSRTAGSLSSCNATAWSQIVSWPVSTVATPPNITTSTPVNNTPICLSGISEITGTLGEGSGGTGFEFGYNINNGTTPTSIITGTSPSSNFTINTTGATTKINLLSRRTGVGVGTCSPTPWALVGQWQVVNEPTSPTLDSKIPNTTSINEGEDVAASSISGNGGAADATDDFRISSDNGSTWGSYTSGNNYTVPVGATKVIIQCQRNAGSASGCTNTSWAELANWVVDVVLPVELYYFNASKNNFNEYATLEWRTASERNSKEFVVERSTNVHSWSVIGKVNAKGNSNIIQSYLFIDSNLITGDIYYRLKMIDLDNSFQYSDIVSVANDKTFNKTISIYPNPTHSNFKLVSSININNYSIIEIKDLIGKVVKHIDIDIDKNNNNNIIEINCVNIAKGSYYVSIYDNDKLLINTIKLVKY